MNHITTFGVTGMTWATACAASKASSASSTESTTSPSTSSGTVTLTSSNAVASDAIEAAIDEAGYQYLG